MIDGCWLFFKSAINNNAHSPPLDFIDFAFFAVDFSRFPVVSGGGFFGRVEHPQMHRFAVNRDDGAIAVVFLVNPREPRFAARLALAAGTGAGAPSQIFEPAIQLVAVFCSHQPTVAFSLVGQEFFSDEFVQVNRLDFERPVGFFPCFLKHSAAAGVFAEVFEKIYF